jgi:hypothetical protein
MRREAVTAVPHSVRFREQIRSSTATDRDYTPSPRVSRKAPCHGTVRGTTCLSALGIVCFPGILVRG